jgi:hypothetical protein
MSLKLNAQSASSADNIATGIRDTGKYIGKITRAEKLLSGNGTQGLGISFKSYDGQTADYLDLYTINASGDDLPSLKMVNAILAVLKLREAQDGPINFEKYDTSTKQREQRTAEGYPSLMGRDIGFLLQKEIYTDQHGADKDRVILYGVFQADTELTASEVLANKTTPEKLPRIIESLMARPIRDKRVSGRQRQPDSQQTGDGGIPDWM